MYVDRDSSIPIFKIKLTPEAENDNKYEDSEDDDDNDDEDYDEDDDKVEEVEPPKEDTTYLISIGRDDKDSEDEESYLKRNKSKYQNTMEDTQPYKGNK